MKNEAFRYIAEERMISDRERTHIQNILDHRLETDSDLLELNELVEDESPGEKRADHGLKP